MIRVYDFGGAAKGQAPAAIQTDWVDRAGELPTLKVSYSALAPHAEAFTGRVEVAYLLPPLGPGQPWREPRNARMVTATDQFERLADQAVVHAYDFVGLASELSSVHVETASAGSDKRQFSAITPGQLFVELIGQAQAAGAVPWLELGFTATTDSYGGAWAAPGGGTLVVTGEIELYKDLLWVLQEKLPAVEWWMQGRTLHMAPMVTDRAVEVYLPDALIAESPEQVDYTTISTHVRIIGEEGASWLFPVPGAPAQYGRRVHVIQVQGITDEGTAFLRAQAEFDRLDRPSESWARQWPVTADTPWLPGIDFLCGDWIKADTRTTQRDSVRIAAQSIQESAAGRVAAVTLGTVHDSLEIRLAKQARGLTGGSAAVEGQPSPPPPPPPEPGEEQPIQWPAAPAGFTISAGAWMTPEGRYQGVVAASWNEVTVDTDGQPVTINDYVLRGRRTSDPAVDWFDLAATSGLSTGATHGELRVGDTWEFAVAASSTEGHLGPFTTPVELVIPPDEVAPDIPSVPEVWSTNSGLFIRWDGLTETGGPMPADLSHLDIVLDGLPGYTWTMDRLVRQRRIQAGGAEPVNVGGTYVARLIAVDRAGNSSEPSAPSPSVELESVLSDTDFAAEMAKTVSWGDNLYPDPGYTSEARNTLRAGTLLEITGGRIRPLTTAATPVWLTPSGQVDGPDASQVSFRTDTEYVIEVQVDAPVGATATITPIRWTGSGWTELATATTVAAGATLRFTHVIAAGSTGQLGVLVTGQPWLGEASLRSRARSVHYGTDSIAAPAIFMDEAFANKVTSALLNADVATIGWIKAGDIAVSGALDFLEATGMRLTSTTVATTGVDNDGIWLDGETNSLALYDPAGNQTFLLDGDTGNSFQSGDFQTSGAFPRLEIKRQLWPDFAGMRWHPNPGWLSWPELKVRSVEGNGELPGGIHLLGGSWHDLTLHPEFHMRSGFRQSGQERFWPEIDITLGRFGVTAAGRIRLKDVGEVKTDLFTQADFTGLHSKTGQSIEFPVVGTLGDIRIRSLNGGVLLDCGNGWITFQNIGATTGGEDLRLEGGWRATYIASMAHLKLFQEKIPPIPEVLLLDGKTWIDRAKFEADPSYSTRYMGFIAEEAEALIRSLPAGTAGHLQPLVQYFDRGTEVSKTLAYTQFMALVLPLIRVLWEDRFGPITDPRGA